MLTTINELFPNYFLVNDIPVGDSEELANYLENKTGILTNIKHYESIISLRDDKIEELEDKLAATIKDLTTLQNKYTKIRSILDE